MCLPKDKKPDSGFSYNSKQRRRGDLNMEKKAEKETGRIRLAGPAAGGDM